jgi:hypothetical protein
VPRQELIDSLQQPCCILCHLGRLKSLRYIETLLDTAVIDVAKRDAWRQAKGLCHWHASVAMAIPQSASSLAILYEDVLNHEIRHLAPLTTSATSSRWIRMRHKYRFTQRVKRWLEAWQQRDRCPVCCLWQTQEQLYMAVLLDDWHDPALRQAFEQSSGLCLPHTVRLMAYGGSHRHLAAILTAQQGRLQSVHVELREFIRKQDYRFSHEPYGSEADAWQRVIALLVGTTGEAVRSTQPPRRSDV